MIVVCNAKVKTITWRARYPDVFLPTSNSISCASVYLKCAYEHYMYEDDKVCWGVIKQILTALTRAMVKTMTPSVIPDRSIFPPASPRENRTLQGSPREL